MFARRRSLAAAAALVVGLAGLAGVLFASSPAQALPDHMTTRTYYSTAAKTTEVGERILLCCWVGCNNTQLWGTTSAYYNTYTEACYP